MHVVAVAMVLGIAHLVIGSSSTSKVLGVTLLLVALGFVVADRRTR